MDGIAEQCRVLAAACDTFLPFYRLTYVPTHSPYSRCARRPLASRSWSASTTSPTTLILAPTPTPSPNPGPTPTPNQVNEHNRIMIPIIFLTETQLEPAEVK